MAEEGLQKTENELIHVGRPISFDTEAFLAQMAALRQAALANDPRIRTLVEAMVSSYHPAGSSASTDATGGVREEKAAIQSE